MSTQPIPEFDVGPLSWVQGEIDQALSRGLTDLATFRANPEDSTALKHARSHVHQAAGAIQMVGLDAVVAYTDELERQLNRAEELPAEAVPAVCDVVDRACRKLKIFLDELVNGAPPVPLKLYPEYEAMQAVRGVTATAPTDLFYPDLSPRAPRIVQRETVQASKRQSHLIKQRRTYQRGLLSWLRGEEAGAEAMRSAVAGIEDVTTQGGLRAFWWTVGAMFEGLVEGGLDGGFGVKQLAARIDLQIRRVGEGSSKVADRLRREVLYFVAMSAPVGPQVQAVQRAFKLAGLIPSAEVLSADVVRLQPILREAREQLAGAKDAWLKAASGRAENLSKLKLTLASVHAKAADIHNGALMKLTSALVERLDKMPSSGVSEPVAMEFATALLLADSAFENYQNLSPEFPRQVDTMLSRLDAARQGRVPGDGGAPILDEMSKRAQERVLLAQVGREIQVNLRHMEQVLDAFFRDNGKRVELGALAKDSAQISGALRILGLDEADRLMGLCEQQIETYADPETPVSNDDLELLAESLSGLGFYIEAVEQQRPDRDRLIAPLIARRLGVEVVPDLPEADSAEAAVAELRAALPRLVDEVHRAPTDAEARAGLKQKLAGLRDDAELIGDPDLAAQVQALLKELDAGDTMNLAAAVEAMVESSAPAPEISEETQRLLETDASDLDGELLEIYLQEAIEVLDAIAAHHEMLARNSGDREALRTIRRGFHTLKGSGRMVGLTELGEIAYEVEATMNRLLDEERPVTAAALNLIAVAQGSFREWIKALTLERRVVADPHALHAAIAAVARELPGGASSPAGHEGPAEQSESASPLPVDASSLNVVELGRGPTSPPPIPPPKIFDLPELGFGGDGPAPVIGSETGLEETIDVVAVPEFDETSALEDVAATLPANVTPLFPTAPAPDSDEITIGDVTLSRSLWAILCDEAAQHLETLRGELSVLQFDSRAAPSAAMVRASHTLCGIHRTGGFPLVALTAKSLEQTLIALELHGVPLPDATQPVLAHAIAGLAELVGRVRAARAFSGDDAHEAATIQQELDLLRQDSAIEGFDPESAAEDLARLEDQAPHSPLSGSLSLLDGIPAAEEPVVEEPIAEESIAEESIAEESIAEESIAEESIAEEPVAEEPVAEEPIAEEPIAEEPVAEEPVAEEPVAATDPSSTAAPGGDAVADEVEVVLAAIRLDPLAGVRDDVDADVLPIFLDEAAELFPQAGEEIRAWRADPLDLRAVAQLRRTLHTFKGSSRMAGAMRLGQLTHLMESRLLEEEAPQQATPELFDLLDEDLDHIAFVLDHLRRGEYNVPLPWVAESGDDSPLSDEALETVEPVMPVAERPISVSPIRQDPNLRVIPEPPATVVPEKDEHYTSKPVPSAPANVERPVVVALPPVLPTPAELLPAAAARIEATPELETGARAALRVRADIIDRLVNEAGEVAIARARVEGELRALKANLLELTNNVIRLRAQMREIEIQAESQIQSSQQLQEQHGEFDPLEFDRYTRFQELTRSLAEGINDVSTVQLSLLKNLDDADAALLAQARLSREVQQRLFSIRTVPFGSLSQRLYRVLRATARELDKRANLEIRGGQVELDRSVLEKLVGPLEHLLRNALDHGIEAPEARRRTGKTEIGEIALTVHQVGNEVVIEMADDGVGIDLDRVRDRAIANELVSADSVPTESQLIECLFAPGFSTSAQVTQISGRGIGMDVVRSEIAALGGRVEVMTTSGNGTRFVLTLPLTLAVTQAVLIRAGGRLWALPAPMVEQVQQVKSQALLDIYIQRKVEWQGRIYPFHYLPRLLGDSASNPETRRYNSVLLLRSGQSRAAVHVDEMVGNQEVVVKNIGPQLARVSGISGATVLGTGEIVLIINPVQLAGRTDAHRFDATNDERAIGDHPRAHVAPVSTQPLVLIVDDSLTVRKITSRFLQREGFAVATARDGVDALQVLGESLPDVILLDIEMPRMDGFEFAKTIKSDARLSGIPIIMITSRTAEKHRSRAAELGVDLYLGKPYQEEELLQNLRDMTGLGATA